RIEVDVASHHPTVDVILPELRAALAELAPQAPVIPVLSTVFPGQTPRFDADYWAANLRHPVHFAQAVTAAGPTHATFIEISPPPLLTHAITENLTGTHHHAIGTLIRDTHDTLTFHTHLNTTHTPPPPPPHRHSRPHAPHHPPPTRAPPPPPHPPLAPHPPLDHHKQTALGRHGA